MKKIMTISAAFLFYAATIAAAATIISCEKYEDGRPLKNVRSEFKSMYPDARDVEWDSEYGYWVVSFELGTRPDVKECEAWYDVNANWLRTETEMFERDLPKAVKDALESSEYASPYLQIDDVDYVETPKGNFYQVDVKTAGREIGLDVTAEGVISLSDIR